MDFTTYQANSKGGLALLALQADSKGGLLLLGWQANSKGGNDIDFALKADRKGGILYSICSYMQSAVQAYCTWQ